MIVEIRGTQRERELMVARFGVKSDWESKEVKVRHGCGIWKSIQRVQAIFWNFIRFKLGL